MENRKNPTLAERKMWYLLLRAKKMKFKFIRQKPLGNYVVDFYCSRLLMAIELDGESHDGKEHYDLKRDDDLQKIGVKVLHYLNSDILKNLEGTYIHLMEQLKIREMEMNISWKKYQTPFIPLIRGTRFLILPPDKGGRGV